MRNNPNGREYLFCVGNSKALSTLLIAGATGLIGSETLRQALDDRRVSRVVVVVRKPIPLEDPKLEQWVARDGDLLSALRDQHVDAVICCLGTTIRNVGGDKQKFVHVDKDLVIGLGQWSKRNNIGCFSMVSAMGADANSRVFYSRVKGETEDALKALKLPQLHLFRPSILTGPRKENRAGERIGIAVAKVLNPLMIGPLEPYKPMPSVMLAKALLQASLTKPGAGVVETHTYRSIAHLAST
ncbi:MAG: NAD(P)H-binding protein [Flavobacteriales bacterium]|nr:NAD(P)H-binding protein [Flavobacteriales bacterium]